MFRQGDRIYLLIKGVAVPGIIASDATHDQQVPRMDRSRTVSITHFDVITYREPLYARTPYWARRFEPATFLTPRTALDPHIDAMTIEQLEGKVLDSLTALQLRGEAERQAILQRRLEAAQPLPEPVVPERPGTRPHRQVSPA